MLVGIASRVICLADGCMSAGGPLHGVALFFSSSSSFHQIYLIFFFFFFLLFGQRAHTHRVAHLRFLLTSPIPVRRGVTLPTCVCVSTLLCIVDGNIDGRALFNDMTTLARVHPLFQPPGRCRRRFFFRVAQHTTFFCFASR